MLSGDRGAGSSAMRSHNVALVLRLIAEHGPISRVDLADRTGLTKATVSALVSELIDAVLVQDIGSAGRTSNGGRPATLLAPNQLGPMAVGVQLNLDHVAGCLVDIGGRVRAKEVRRVRTGGMSPAELVRNVRRILGSLLAASVDADRLVAGVGVAVPAIVAGSDDPVVAWAPQFGWRNVDLGTLVAGELASFGLGELPVRIGNDTAFAAKAEFRVNPAPGVAVYVGGASEVGVAVLVDGVLTRGTRIGGSGFGHVPLRGRRDRCPCGARGCLDRYAGQAAMQGGSNVRAAGEALGDALSPLLAALDPDLVVIGGRLGSVGSDLIEALRHRVDMFMPGLRPRQRLRVGTLDAEAAMRGAALSVVDEIVDDPVGWMKELVP
jgi:predicted NBD/HSP70 family sugar kinase